jgi:predicted dehydrogenase
MKNWRVAFIGTGGRSVIYADTYQACDDIDIVGLADPVAEHRKAVIDKAGLAEGIPEFDHWQDMLNNVPDIDGIVISTPNDVHADQAVACLERGLPIALEKPLATTKEDCERIIAAENGNSGRILLGFVLRSTPFYSKLHELIVSEAIGRVVSIQADELPGLGVSSIMNRSQWRRHASRSGGSMLEKSCHDMDILNWMMGCRPTSLTSYGACLIFRPDPSLPDVCDNCHRASTCLYYEKPVFSSHEDEGEETLHEFIREDNRCIYNIDKDVVDVQSMAIEYESGAVANFMLSFNCMGPRAGRNFHAVGTKGRVWGNIGEKTVFLHDNLKAKTFSFDTSGDGSGHGGGDRLHALLLRMMMQEPTFIPEQGTNAGYLSAVMCFAADLSRSQHRRVDFAYGPDGLITLS